MTVISMNCDIDLQSTPSLSALLEAVIQGNLAVSMGTINIGVPLLQRLLSATEEQVGRVQRVAIRPVARRCFKRYL